MDLVSLRKYVEENTEPGPNPILDLQKGKILEMWDGLETEGKCKPFASVCGVIVIAISDIIDRFRTSSEEIQSKLHRYRVGSRSFYIGGTWVILWQR